MWTCDFCFIDYFLKSRFLFVISHMYMWIVYMFHDPSESLIIYVCPSPIERLVLVVFLPSVDWIVNVVALGEVLYEIIS